MRAFLSRFRVWIAALLATTAGAGAMALTQGTGTVDVFVGSTPTPTVAPGANLWIDSNGGTCTFSASAVAYVDAAACSSTSAAYSSANTASASASTVAVKEDSYGPQSIADSARTGGTISFVEDGIVTFTSLSINGDKTAWTGFTIVEGLPTTAGATRMKGATFTDVIAQGGDGVGAWFVNNAQDLTFIRGEICCGQSLASSTAEGFRTGGGASTATASANILIDGAHIHSWDRDGSGTHTECMLVIAVQGFTLRNSHLDRCTVYGLSIGRIGGDIDPVDHLIENNTFEPSDDLVPGDQDGNSNVVLDHVSTRFDGLIFRNNSFSQPIEINTADVPDSTGYDETFFYSNIIPSQTSCVPGGMTSPTYDYNLMTTGDTCGTNSTAVANPRALYADVTTSGAWNFELSLGSAAIGVGSPTNSSATDRDGCARSDPDAGAYEYPGC